MNQAGEEEDKRKVVGPGLWTALKAAASDWSAHKSAKAGAAIAYYSILFPWSSDRRRNLHRGAYFRT
jgi:hypothetical protein